MSQIWKHRDCQVRSRLLPNPRGTDHSSRRQACYRGPTPLTVCAFLLVLACFVEPVAAQVTHEPAKDSARAEELKRGIDRALARVLRDLRTELHRAVDDAFRTGDSMESLLLELDQLSLRTEASPQKVDSRKRGPTPAERLQTIERQMQGLGSASSEGSIKATEPDLESLLPAVADWADLGITLGVPPKDQVQGDGMPVVLHVASVADPSAAHRAGVRAKDRLELEPCAELRTGRLRPGRLIKGLRYPTGDSKGQTVVLEVPDGPSLEAARIVKSLYEQAIKDVVPKNGVLTPTEPTRQQRAP